MRSVLKKGLRINFQVLLDMYSVASCLTCIFFYGATSALSDTIERQDSQQEIARGSEAAGGDP